MSVKKKQNPKTAKAITDAMATWTFILLFLAACIIEIVINKVGVAHFDPTMLVLNTVLSLLAAIQGSVIMIYQKYQDAERDAILRRLDKHDKAIMKELKEDSHGHDSSVRAHH